MGYRRLSATEAEIPSSFSEWQGHLSRFAEDFGSSLESWADRRNRNPRTSVGSHAGCGARLRRADDILNRTGPEVLTRVLQSLNLRSLDQVDRLEVLKRVVLALEKEATA